MFTFRSLAIRRSVELARKGDEVTPHVNLHSVVCYLAVLISSEISMQSLSLKTSLNILQSNMSYCLNWSKIVVRFG